jgi:hypothetical protein
MKLSSLITESVREKLTEDEELSDVDVEEGKMSDILGVPEEERIGDAYDGSAQDAAEELVDAVGEQEAAGMINYAANISGDSFLEDMQDALKNIDEMNESSQFRNVVRKLIKQELSEMTTTAAVPGYQTPFAFGDEEDDKKEDDIEEFLDTYGWEMAELAEKARKEGLTEDEEKKLKQYIQKVRSMRDGDVSGYKKKSNYLPHNLEEAYGDGGPISTPNHILKVSGRGESLRLGIFEKLDRGEMGQHVTTIQLGKQGGQALHEDIIANL